MNRRRFLQTSVLGAAPVVFGIGVGTAVDQSLDDHGKGTAARSARHGTQRIVWSGTDTEAVALTFDDGPDPGLTSKVLDALARHGVQATFLVIGSQVERHPDLVRRAVDEGHELGNHTFSHHSLAVLEPDAVRTEVARTADAIERAVPGTPVRFFRPPRGILTGAGAQVAGEHGYDVLLWSCTRGPEAATTPEAVGNYLHHHLKPGTIACLHDGTGRSEMSRWPWHHGLRAKREVEVAALPGVLDRAIGAGVRFVTVSDLVR